MDKTIINIIAMLMGGVGLIGAITKYDFPKAHKTFYGQNPFRLKLDIVNDTVTKYFTIYAALGMIVQLLFGEIFQDKLPESRFYGDIDYLLILIAGLFVSWGLVRFIKWMSKANSRYSWEPEIIRLFQSKFIEAKSVIENEESSEKVHIKEKQEISSMEQAIKVISALEELLEVKTKKADLKERVKTLEPFFKKN